MRGTDQQQDGLFSYPSLESRIPADHPLRPIRRMVNQARSQLSPLFDTLYAAHGRKSIPPERLLRAQLLQILYGIPSERRLMEQIDFNLLFRWFVGLPLDEPVWHPTTFTQNRDRLLTHAVARQFFLAVRAQADAARLLSREHFTVDGTLIDAAASLKSFRPKDGDGPDEALPGGGRNAEVNFHGLIVETELTAATSTAEREAALSMLDRHRPNRCITLAADKGTTRRTSCRRCGNVG